MAIAPTGAIYKALKFDNVSSRTYGVYITGEAVYNAPERDVEMITIPGRNGSFALDNGRFQNIEVSYPAGIFAETEADFRQAISDFRNFLCSRNGYVRLQDEYNPDEYRMAVYKSGLEVDPAMLKAGEFTITFDCKPQRWLTSGETEVTIASSGDTITNPTLFESSPLLEVEGYGDIGIGGETITIQNEVVGHVDLPGIPAKQYNVVGGDSGKTYNHIYTFDSSVFNAGDVISIAEIDLIATIVEKDTGNANFDYTHIVHESSTTFSFFTLSGLPYTYTGSASIGWYFQDMTFVVGTSKTYYVTTTYDVLYTRGLSTERFTITGKVLYDGADTITLRITLPADGTHYKSMYWNINEYNTKRNDISGESTKSILGNPLYIDLDLGEAWNEDSGTPISVNNAVSIPATLPTLASGTNEITYDNTITNLKIIPRWWKV